tara:strand:- start:680 stop:1201 length:522 start_codon:yes stop_codon:yes gene_type:complete
MKYKIIAISVTIVLALFLLMGCSGSEEATAPEPAAEEAAVPAPDAGEVEEAVVEEQADEEEETEEADTELEEPEEEEAPATPEVKEFRLSGKNYEFSLDEIKVNQGDTVKIVFRSESGSHDWVVDEFDAATERVQADEESSVEFVADKAGTFEFYCSVGDHRTRGMVGKLIVE